MEKNISAACEQMRNNRATIKNWRKTSTGRSPEHMDMFESIEPTVENMEKPKISTRQTQHYISQMRIRTSPGPDGIKNELYKALARNTRGIEVITKCMNNELSASRKPQTWKSSYTRMIPKVSKPTAKQLRAIAHTSYKIFMSMIREKMKTT